MIGDFKITTNNTFNPQDYIKSSLSTDRVDNQIKIIKYIDSCCRELLNLTNFDSEKYNNDSTVRLTNKNFATCVKYENVISIFNIHNQDKISKDMHTYCSPYYDPKWNTIADNSSQNVHVFQFSRMKTANTSDVDLKSLNYDFVRQTMIAVHQVEIKEVFNSLKELIYPKELRTTNDEIIMIYMLISMFPALFFVCDNDTQRESILSTFVDHRKNVERRFFTRDEYDRKGYISSLNKVFSVPDDDQVNIYVLAEDVVSIKMILTNPVIFTCNLKCKWVYSPLFVPNKKKMVIIQGTFFSTNRIQEINREILEENDKNPDINYFIYGLNLNIRFSPTESFKQVLKHKNTREIVLNTSNDYNNYELIDSIRTITNYIISFFGLQDNMR